MIPLSPRQLNIEQVINVEMRTKHRHTLDLQFHDVQDKCFFSVIIFLEAAMSHFVAVNFIKTSLTLWRSHILIHDGLQSSTAGLYANSLTHTNTFQ